MPPAERVHLGTRSGSVRVRSFGPVLAGCADAMAESDDGLVPGLVGSLVVPLGLEGIGADFAVVFH